MQSLGARGSGVTSSVGSRLRYGCEASVRRATSNRILHHQSISNVSTSAAATEFILVAPRAWLLPAAALHTSNCLIYAANPCNPGRNPLLRHERNQSLFASHPNDAIVSKPLASFHNPNEFTSHPANASYASHSHSHVSAQNQTNICNNNHMNHSVSNNAPNSPWKSLFAPNAFESFESHPYAPAQHSNASNGPSDASKISSHNSCNNSNSSLASAETHLSNLSHLEAMQAEYYPTPGRPVRGLNSHHMHQTHAMRSHGPQSRQDVFAQQRRFGSSQALKNKHVVSELDAFRARSKSQGPHNWSEAQTNLFEEEFPSEGKHKCVESYGKHSKYGKYAAKGGFLGRVQRAARRTSKMQLDPMESYYYKQSEGNAKVLAKNVNGQNIQNIQNIAKSVRNAGKKENMEHRAKLEQLQRMEEPGASRTINMAGVGRDDAGMQQMQKQANQANQANQMQPGAAEAAGEQLEQLDAAALGAMDSSVPDKNRVNNAAKLANLGRKGGAGGAGAGSGAGRGGMNISQQTMAREDEINPLSLGGLFVILFGAAVFYKLYKVDQQASTGIGKSWFSRLGGKSRSLEDYIEAQEKRPLELVPDEWNVLQVIVDHVYKAVTHYNSESIISKLFRLFHVPDKRLLQSIKSKYAQRTLVLDLDTICHQTWSRQGSQQNNYYERKMRPGYHEFLLQAAQAGWEIVIFGAYEDMDWMESPDMALLDGRGFVTHYLWNKDMYYFNGHRCKDLSRLNRNLSKVIVIDCEPRNVQMQPKNAIILPRWSGEDENDQELTKLTEFITYLQKADVPDVRSVLEEYRGMDIGEEFRRRYYAAILRAQGQTGEQEGEFSEDEYDDE